MWFVAGTFLFSFVGIMGLLALKEWEIRHDRTLAPGFRARVDALALRVRELLLALQADLEKLSPEILHVVRVLIHEIALLTAAFLRFLASQAHRLADLVSHRRTFQRRASRSEFLKKVLEHKNGGGERSE